MEKISLPKGTRDFGPEQMAKRQFIIDSIKTVFQRYGFQPLETPAMENLDTLTGKYGDEGDQLLFRILNSGDFEKSAKSELDLLIVTCGTPLRELMTDIRDDLTKIGKLDDLQAIDKSLENKINNSNNWRFKKLFSLSRHMLFDSIVKWIRQTDYSKRGTDFMNDVNEKRNSLATELIHAWTENQQHLSDLQKTFFTEKGLRYDLTVPFARYVVMNRHEIPFPFKRYQIQPVWRADRPQKGRYREFYQCDADVVGTDSLVCEAEIILMIKDAFKTLGISDYSIKINHRGILSGLAEMIGAGENENSLFVSIDKLDKIGEEKVKEELTGRGFNTNSLPLLFEVLNFKGSSQQKVEMLTSKFENSEKGRKGIADLLKVLSLVNNFGSNDQHVEFDITLARGLSYYTGCIFEVKINNVAIGSVSGGGRYDNLTAVFDAKEKSSGVGFSFGIDRIYDAMDELNIFPKDTTAASTILITHLDENAFHYGLKTVQAFRDLGIASEIYPDKVKIKKQMEYADRKKIPFVVVIGADEVQTGQLTLKKMETGNQLKLSFEEIATAIQLHSHKN